MEETTPQAQTEQLGQYVAQTSSTNIKQKNNGSRWVIIFILLLVVGGAGIYFFTKSASDPIATPTPSFGVVPIEEKEIPTPAPTKTPAPVKKETVTIEIKNGTGITGEAKLLQDKLKTIGYTEVTVGNADSTDNTETTITFKKTLSQQIQDEIKKELESFYKKVNISTSSTLENDILIVTGLRSGSGTSVKTTATPSASTSSKATASPKSSSTASPSASPKSN